MKRYYWLAMSIIIGLTALACNLPASRVNQAGVEGLEVDNALLFRLGITDETTFTYTLSEAQVESQVLGAVASNAASLPAGITNIGVDVDPGEIRVTGDAPIDTFVFSGTVTGAAIVVPFIDGNGNIVADVEAIAITNPILALGVSDQVIEEILGRDLAITYTGEDAAQQVGFDGDIRFTGITVNEGEVVITGVLSQ